LKIDEDSNLRLCFVRTGNDSSSSSSCSLFLGDFDGLILSDFEFESFNLSCSCSDKIDLFSIE